MPVQVLFQQAIDRRVNLIATQSNAVRLIDGEGDALPGIVLESFADRWLLSTPQSSIPRAFSHWLQQQQRSVYHKRLDQHQKDSPQHLCGPLQPEAFLISEHGLKYEISFQSGYSQGIFLDQRDNRLRVKQRCRPGMTVLNTFAYTGAFSIAAASAGAMTTTLDLSAIYLNWAKRNFMHNGLNPDAHHFCKGDTFHWLQRFARQGRRFDGIILDPPTFSRDDKGQVFRVESDYLRLLKSALACLNPGGWMLCSTNCYQMTMPQFKKQLAPAIHKTFQLDCPEMPIDFVNRSYLKSLWIST